MTPQLSGHSALRGRTWNWLLDAGVFAVGFALIWAVVLVARYWSGTAVPQAEISRSPSALPLYAFYSLVRIGVAYVLSLLFAVGYGYIAAYSDRFRALMLAALDILQSIPVLSFLPGVMLAMVSLFPTRQIGLELGSIVLIFTGQVWNMAFSFYASLQAIPRELREAANIYDFSRWQRFFELELPYGAIGLVWNSMISVAGGWFFLMACEMFVLGNRDFRLPGLGSYLQSAASAGDTGAVLWGMAAMIGIIVLLDQVVWRPVIAWADKFKMEQIESSAVPASPMLRLLHRSPLLIRIRTGFTDPMAERTAQYFAKHHRRETSAQGHGRSGRTASVVVAAVLIGIAGYAIFDAFAALRVLHSSEFALTVRSAAYTFARVAVSLVLTCLWTIPAGVAAGSNPRVAKVVQPLAQIAASVPATALFPVLLLAIIALGGGLGTGSILLMLLGTQWYVLFNVIAGAMAIPSDLREASAVFHFRTVERWRIVILPAIFPYLVTGLVTASGGAWNASIVAEYFHFQGRVLSTVGLGAQISSATDSGNFRLLLLSTLVMAAIVVAVNRLLWRPLYRLAETRFRLEA